MVNIYNWSYQIDNNLVRIEYTPELKKYIQSNIKKFSGVVMPTKVQSDELIIKFKNSKTVADFISTILENYPNSFHLQNSWDICKGSSTMLSFTSLSNDYNSIFEMSELAKSLFEDCKVISSLTKNEISDIQVNIDSSICYFTFNINFPSSDEAELFLKDFNNFKA